MRPTPFPRTGSLTAFFQSSERTEIQPKTTISETARTMRPQTGRVGQLLTAAVLCMTLVLATNASAQQATAKILGTITDPQGLVLPGVKVTVTNTATNVSSETTTDKYGFYQVLDLPIGTYRIVAVHEGFRRIELTTAPLQINQSFRADLKLEVGTVSEQVLVEAQAAGVETVNPTIGQSITSRPVVNLPLNGRNVLTLALLQPGVTEDNPTDDGQGSNSNGGPNFNVGGGRSDSVTYLLDGGTNNELLGNGVVYNPNPDAVAEFRILTSNYTAEYGRNGAGVVSVVTKSGTNSWHGSAFEFVRNTDFDANAYFNKNLIANPNGPFPRNNLKRNQFGATFGGPIIKNRLFFFASYQGQRQVETDVLPTQTVFTPAELKGDFSGGGSPGNCPNADPNVAAFLQVNTYFQSNAASAACAIIDPTKIDPAAQAYIATGLVPSSLSGTELPAAGGTNSNNELTAKIDYEINEKNKLTGTVGGFRNPHLQPFGSPAIGYASTVPGFPSVTTTHNYFLNVAYTRTFSSTQLNELRVTAQRHNTLNDKPVTNMPAISQFGIISNLSDGPPLMSFDLYELLFGPDQRGPAYEIGNTYAIADTFSWVRGRNSWKFGGGFSDYQQNTQYAFFTDSEFSFYDYSSGGDDSGNALADFLLGAPNGLYEASNAANNIRSKAVYVFAQDEWRVRPNLTLSLGIRYEYNTPKLDTKERSFSIVPGVQSLKYPSAPLGLVFPGDPGAPRGANFPDRTNFAPRFGFAWSPGSSSRTSIRGGFGIFYDVLKGEDNLQFNGAPPFYPSAAVGFPCLQPVPGCATLPITSANQQLYPLNQGYPATVWTNCPPTSGLPFYCQPWANSLTPIANPFAATTAFDTCQSTGYICPDYNFLPYGGAASGIYFVNPHLHTPYVYQYNLSVQQEVSRSLIAEINYVGSSSKGLTALQDINPFDLSTLNGTPARILNENQSTALQTYCALNAANPANCPFGGLLQFNNIAFASFNSLEASLTKQLSESRWGNSYFTLAYTWGHSIDNASGFRQLNSSQVPYYAPGVFRASSDFDITNRITFSGGWDLPFDQAWASGPKRLVKGWSLYPIFSWRTGFPLDISSGLPNFNSADPGPSGAGDPYLSNAIFAPGFNSITILNPKTNGNYYFNPAAFEAIPDTYTTTDPYGLPRNFFRGPGRTNLDMAVAKTTPITERVNLEMRLEAFNVLNHAEFADPNVTLGSSSFGQISSTTFGTGVYALQTQRILQLGARLTF